MSSSKRPEQDGLLNDASSPPFPSPEATALSPAQHIAARHRPGYARVSSVSFTEDTLTRDNTEPMTEEAPSSGRHGLGIAMSPGPKPGRSSLPSILRESMTPDKGGIDEQASGSSTPFTGAMSGSTQYNEIFSDLDTSYSMSKSMKKDSRTSLQSTLPPSTYARSETGLLSVRSRYDEFEPNHHCQSKQGVKRPRFSSWVPVTILVLAVFSSVFSGIFLGIALSERVLAPNGGLNPPTAAFLTSLFAKLIELSFVTVVVAFVGQALARRAHKLEDARGVTLAEMTMRTWIMQPGTLLTNWESVRYASLSVLGVISLLAAVAALLYTSAATALVQPQLKFTEWKSETLGGLVRTQYSNPTYIADGCKTPITKQYDPVDEGKARQTACNEVEHAAMAYHNYHTWIGTWTDAINSGNGSSNFTQRPIGYAMHQDNTTITAPWINTEFSNITTVNETGTETPLEGRWVNNVTMAMPHIGVIQAAMDPINKLVQPDDLNGGAQVNIRASVPSPMINVLCVTMKEQDLRPFVYSLWNTTHKDWDFRNGSGWPNNYGYADPYLGVTDFHDTFQWGPKYGASNFPPVFPKLPLNFNTLVNDTTNVPWGRKTIYILGKGGDVDRDSNPTTGIGDEGGTNYALCQLQAGLTSSCSTHYNASSSGATMEARCDNDADPLLYRNSATTIWDGKDTLAPDWPNIGGSWAKSLSLSAGITDNNASNARILTQMIVTKNEYSSALPSMAEALAVMSGCTLIQSITDSPFVAQPWNYTLPTIEPGQHQYFKASVRAQKYISGGTQDYEKAFHLILFAVFFMNVIILIYFIIHKDWYTDFSEPNNLFSLAVNSPPSEKLAGSCGCGPSGDQYRVSWKLNNDDGHFYYEAAPDNVVVVRSPGLKKRWSESFEMMGSPVTAVKNRFSRTYN